MTARPRLQPRVAIIGSGFGGLCMAIQLKKAGVESFTILEKAAGIGGTWRDNTYPGAACDSPSLLYSYSFEPKTDWPRKWSPQAVILRYLEHCARKYGLAPHVRLNAEVTTARFDTEAGVWRITLRSGETLEAEVLVSSVGQLNRPTYPDIPGLHDFKGIAFHSARWRHDCDLTDKHVAVIGNAASAVQFVPEIAARVKRLTVFQRSANWMIPKCDRTYSEREKARFGRSPLLTRLYRWLIYLSYEVRFPVFLLNAPMSRWLQGVAERNLLQKIRDPTLRQALTPDYPIGGKRILISDDYYTTLERDDVDLVTTPIDRITANGVATTDGATVPADVLILATGFESTSFLVPMRIEGPGGRSLEAAWHDGAEAFLGVTVAGFPNFFMLYGPNTNLGHNSIIFMLECQVRYVMSCIAALQDRGLKSLDVRRHVMETYNRELATRLSKTVWARTATSWYKRRDGRITNNWSGTTAWYWWRTRAADLDDYEQRAWADTVESEVAKVA